MAKVLTVNGKIVKMTKDRDWDKRVELLDIVGSGQGVNELSESEWHINELDKLLDGLNDDEKVELFVLTVNGASDGWYLNDITFLARSAGVRTFELEVGE